MIKKLVFKAPEHDFSLEIKGRTTLDLLAKLENELINLFGVGSEDIEPTFIGAFEALCEDGIFEYFDFSDPENRCSMEIVD